jgi:hypothetical protein
MNELIGGVQDRAKDRDRGLQVRGTDAQEIREESEYQRTLKEKIRRFKQRNQDWKHIPHNAIAISIHKDCIKVKYYFLE